MKWNRSIWQPLSVMLLFSFACRKDNRGNEPQDKEYEVFSTTVPGFSGLCYSATKTSFYAASDNGTIYEIATDGSTIRQLPVTGNYDFEAIAIDAVQDRLYIADESLMNLYWLTPNQNSLNLVTHISIPGGVSNKGIEGLAFGPDTLYIVNQESPTLLIKYALGSQAETHRIPVDFASYLSDIFFDPSDNSLWICDSQQQLLFHCTLNGTLIATQDIDFVPKAEALVIDRAGNTAWIGCDQSSKLFKVKLKI
jgi:uncharacterized protein YjiK